MTTTMVLTQKLIRPEVASRKERASSVGTRLKAALGFWDAEDMRICNLLVCAWFINCIFFCCWATGCLRQVYSSGICMYFILHFMLPCWADSSLVLGGMRYPFFFFFSHWTIYYFFSFPALSDFWAWTCWTYKLNGNQMNHLVLKVIIVLMF
jgi:hypothetical protein